VVTAKLLLFLTGICSVLYYGKLSVFRDEIMTK